MTIERFETDYSGKRLIIEYGRMGHQADASVTARIGDTMVLATVCISNYAREGMDFFPLMVDYEERYSAVGKIKGPRFLKREGRPSTEAVLIGRMIDRGIRPLFPEGLRNEVQVIIMPLSLDGEVKPDIVGMIAATTALEISGVPFDGPITGCRVAMVGGEFVINPTVDEIEFSEINMVVMGDGKRITMVDCDARELDDENALKTFEEAMKAMGPITNFMKEVREKIGKPKKGPEELKWRISGTDEDQKVIDKIKKKALPELDSYLFNKPVGSKGERKAVIAELEEKIIEEFKKKLKTKDRSEDETESYLRKLMSDFFFDFIEDQVTLAILDEGKRVDGRRMDEIRKLTGETSIVPRSHGSALFSRGETQILSFVTLGAPGDDLIIESMETDDSKKYFHHYNFMPFSVGEVKPLRGAGRREIGHGALAEKALLPVLPRIEEFPYTIRVVSEVMGSNGSSSMGSTVGSTLALMDAGVPIKKPVAGIAMGLASDGKRYKVLTDLQDLEDGKGGMDFKFTSTEDGITAVQMDTKTSGLTMDIIKDTFPQMRKAISEIIAFIKFVIPEPKKEISEYAPRIIALSINPEKIGEVIGPGGKVIRALCEDYDVQIDVEDDGTVMVTSTNADKAKQVEAIIKSIVRDIEVGDIFEDAEVVKIMPFGAFVRLTPKTDGLLHVSELEWGHVEKVTDRVQVGDRIRVKVIEIDRGKVEVSLKALTPRPPGMEPSGRRDQKRSGPPRRPQRRDGPDQRRGPPRKRRD
ncbi:MAG: polyribonucleotide nucleotidyltransferase [Candidatus Thermoplasmatota archaeon]|nr:polyribonucleotide nucleotidyltransferase [Candidatus Thermoplasmatota archaeon]